MDKDALIAALHKADAAGDTEGAQHLAAALRNMAAPAAEPTPEPATEPTPAPVAPHKASLLDNIGGAIKEAFLPDEDKIKARAVENATNLKRGVGVVAQDPHKLVDLGEQQIRSFTAPVGGDVVAAAGSAVAGKGFNPAEQRQRRQGLEQEFGDVASGIPKTLGALGAGGVAAKAGGPVLGGAISGGVTGTNETGDLGEGVKDAVIGGGLGQVARVLTSGIKLSDIPTGVRVLAKRLKMTPQEVEAARQTLVSSRGPGAPPPSVAEIVDDATKARLKPVMQSQKPLADAAKVAETQGELARPDILKSTVANGQSLTNPQEILAKRDDVFNALVDPVRDKAGTVSTAEAKLLLHRDAFRSIDDDTRNRLTQAVQTGKATFLTVGQADSLRRTLGTAVQAAAKDGSNLKPLKAARNLARMIGERTAPEYKQAMTAYEKGGDLARGAKAGEGVRTADTTTTVDAASRANPDEAAGLALGTRNALANDVRNSFGSSGRAAEQLQNPGLRARVAANMGQPEADRLANAGQLEAKAAQNLSDLNPTPGPKPQTLEEAVKLSALGGAAVTGRVSGGGLASIVGNVFSKLKSLGISKNAAQAMASDLFDPQKSAGVVRLLKAHKLDTVIRDHIAKQVGAGASAEQGENVRFRLADIGRAEQEAQ